MSECRPDHLYNPADGLVHIERPRWHLPLCDDNLETHSWQLVMSTPVSCLSCLVALPHYWEL